MDLIDKVSLKSILSNMLDSYLQKDKELEFAEWLADKLCQEMPDMSKEASEKLVEEILKAVKDYEAVLNELNVAIEEGETKEEWLGRQLEEIYMDMPCDVVGERLQEMETMYANTNAQLIGSKGNEEWIDNAEVIEWNRYSIKDKAYKIGKQSALIGIAAVQNAMAEMDSESGYNEKNLGEILRENLKSEVKAVVAGAAKVAIEKKLNDKFSDMPTETICDMTGVAVESADALYGAANGDITMTEALDKIGRAGIVAGCRAGKLVLQNVMMKVPVVGPLLVDLFGGLLGHMESNEFCGNVYTVVRQTAVATWEGMKKSVSKKVNVLKNILHI